MDRVQLLVIGLPLFLFCSDILHLFGPPPPPPPKSTAHHQQSKSLPVIPQTLQFPTQKASIDIGGIGTGNTVKIDFCSSCSYRQFGMIGIVMAGEQNFPRLGYAAPPPWYYSLRANRFGTISSTWLLGNFLQSFLQNSGAFEVSCNGELVISKLKDHRFPGEIELKDRIGKKIAGSRVLDGLGGVV